MLSFNRCFRCKFNNFISKRITEFNTFVVDNTLDTITEGANQGTDTVQSSVTWTLGDNLENLTLTGVLNRRGLRSMTLYDVWPLRVEQPRLVGIAFTMRFIPAREDLATPAAWSSPRSTRVAVVPVRTITPSAASARPITAPASGSSRGSSR